jgi:tetratricopeptide (TPR) repeat protein
VLQRAAVIGRDFDEPLLAAVAESPTDELRGALKRLVDAEYLIEQSVYPVAEYAFKHPLTQQVAEESQLRDVRQRAHRLAAEALEALHAERVEEIAARLAHHRLGAGDVLAAARWHRAAAMWISISDREEELRHWRSIVAHADALGEREGAELVSEACWRILGLAWRGMVDSSECAELIRLSRACAARVGDDEYLMLALTAHGAQVNINEGAFEEGRALGEEVLELARRSSDPMLELKVRVLLDNVNLFTGNLVAAQAGYERTCELSGGDATLLNHGGQAALPVSLCFIADIQHQRGQHDAARATLQRALDSSNASERTETPFFCLTLPMLMEILVCGADANTLRRAQRESELVEQAQAPIFRSTAELCIGLLDATRGDPDAAVERLEANATAVPQLWLPLLWSGVSIAHRRADRHDAARAAAERAVGDAQRMGSRTYECAAQLAFAEALLVSERAEVEAVEAALARTESLIEATGARGFVPLVVEARSKVARVTGDVARAEQLLREAHQLFASTGATVHAERVMRALGAAAG